MSPTTQLLHRKVLIDRSQLLLSGRELELMKQMSNDERRYALTARISISNGWWAPLTNLCRITANWLHDFYMFSFVTTKYWGKGPKDWTLEQINAKTLPLPTSNPSGSRTVDFAHSSPMAINVSDSPTQLCNWSIHHLDSVSYDYNELTLSRPTKFGGAQDIEDESTWQEWAGQDYENLTTKMVRGLEANSFTTYKAEDLPLAVDCIADTVSKSPEDAKVEALGFAIITRNLDVLIDQMDTGGFGPAGLRQLSPFHLAAKFLDGSRACCGIMHELVQCLDIQNSIGVNYTNEFGVTVLDTLFTSILRSHTSVTAQSIGTRLGASGTAFEGGDVDICGRWDADSPCVRHLHAMGESTIPHEWKHVFCHTSVQAVCHCISAIFMSPGAPNINTASGLFQRRCRHCGSELNVGVLQALVLVCFHLASAGRPGETLFGMLACLVCLLTFGADPTYSAEISISAVLGLEETEECQHQRFNAAELASAVPCEVVSSWTSEVQLGWEAFKEVLNHCVARDQVSTGNSYIGQPDFSSTPKDAAYDYEDYIENHDDSQHSDDLQEECSFHDYHFGIEKRFPHCGDKKLGMIWAAIQVELLTYRRLSEEDPWLSVMFEMRDVVEGLRARDNSIIRRLVEARGQDTLKPFSDCGIFMEAEHSGCVRREEACAFYFANLDDWKRTTFIAARENIC